MGARRATTALASAMTSTDAIASDADDHVDPHSSANCTIDFVSSSMKPAPRKKKCQDQGAAGKAGDAVSPSLSSDPDLIRIRSGSDLARVADPAGVTAGVAE